MFNIVMGGAGDLAANLLGVLTWYFLNPDPVLPFLRPVYLSVLRCECERLAAGGCVRLSSPPALSEPPAKGDPAEKGKLSFLTN